MLAIMKREFNSYFLSPLGYVFLAVFYAFSGLFLYMYCLSMGSADISGVFQMMFFIMLIMIPILTMRLMADDKKQKTDQLTLTSPVSLFGVVFGKFLAAFAIFAIAVAMLLVYALILSTVAAVSWPSVLGNTIGILLLGMLFISADLFISSLTENQMIAAIVSIGLNLFIYLLDAVKTLVPIDFIQNIVGSLSVYYKFSEFTYGIFKIENVLFFISYAVVFNFFTMRILERRRWS